MAINLNYDVATWLRLNRSYRPLQIYTQQNEVTAVPESIAENTCKLIKTNMLVPETQLPHKPSPELIHAETAEITA